MGGCVDSDLGHMMETNAVTVMEGVLELVGDVLIEGNVLALVIGALVS